ncbi:MAG: hypothetical protein ACI9XZ_003802 [Alphaproteobacteria bacterium]
MLAAKRDELKVWIWQQGLQSQGAPTYAYYNDPFTSGFLSHNEAIFEVRK